MTKPLSTLSLLLLFASLVARAAPADHAHIHRDAHDVLNKTYHLGAVLRAKTGYSHITFDAFKLRNALQHFTRTMHGANPSHEHIRNDFARVTQAHNHFAHVYSRAHGVHHDRHIAADYRAVERAYHHLERVVQTHLNRPRYDHGRHGDHHSDRHEDHHGDRHPGRSSRGHAHIHKDAHEALNKTYHLGAVLRAKTGYSHITFDAFKLRNALQHFVRLMHGSHPSHHDIRNDFARVTHAHNHLAQMYNRAHGVHHDRHIASDYRAVERAYHHLERVVRAHLDRHGHGHHH